jgi:hypothetical protein
MTGQPSLNRLIDLLSRGTEKGNLHWSRTAQAGAFRASLGHGMVQIEKGAPGVSSPSALGPYTIRVEMRDQKGDLLHAVDVAPGHPERERLDGFYQLVRQQALDLDKALEALVGELEEKAGPEPQEHPVAL